MSFRYEVRLSGEGGQGLVLAGKVLAEAAAIYDDKNATQSQSYGPEARGGASRSEVIISDDDIDYPKAVDIDLLLAEGVVHLGPEIVLPHPRFHRRAFALAPAAEIVPHWVHPLLGRTVGELAADAIAQDPEAVERVGSNFEF